MRSYRNVLNPDGRTIQYTISDSLRNIYVRWKEQTDDDFYEFHIPPFSKPISYLSDIEIDCLVYLYTLARCANKRAGKKVCSIDHMIPVNYGRGCSQCGVICEKIDHPDNLRLMSHGDNIAKKNWCHECWLPKEKERLWSRAIQEPDKYMLSYLLEFGNA